MNRLSCALVSLGVVFAASGARADYTEAIDGELSDDRFKPTDLDVLEPGSNVLTGTIGRSPIEDMPDLDYVTAVVPEGHLLTRLIVRDSDVGGAVSFIGVQAGEIISVPWDTVDASPLLGWTHYGSADEGRDILPAMGAGRGAIGFVPPLPAGTYTFWIMELDTAREYNYSFDLQVRPVPAPGASALLALAALGVARRRR